MWAKIITIKRTKDLNYFSLCALNLFNTRVSQFELNYWNKLTFPRHSNLLRCSCMCVCVCVCVYYFNPVSLFVYLLIFMFFLLQGVLPIVTFSIHISLVFAHALISQPEAWWDTNHESRKLCQVCLLKNLFSCLFLWNITFSLLGLVWCASLWSKSALIQGPFTWISECTFLCVFMLCPD